VRAVVSRKSWWGEPAAVVKVGNPPLDLTAHLLNHPSVGFRPELQFELDRSRLTANPDPALSGLASIMSTAKEYRVHNALVVSDAALSNLALALEACRDVFERVILVDTRPGMRIPWAASVDLAGVTGLEIRHNLLNPTSQAIKRIMDVCVAALGILMLLPGFALVALAIKLDTPGSVLYRQRRVGKQGGHFDMFKFRTMFQGADQLLVAHLQGSDALRAEWQMYQKLRNDPRVTRVGRWLRKFSVDELPQLWNVLRGEMSLVGPRPYFPEQQDVYGKGYESYIRVPPGMTGTWQVSGRNRTSFESRVAMDEDYVRNWSVFLDIYLLARTVPAVFDRNAAF
jgi:Undecaprenyl-phosphate galactose phosphotransferase WbaP